MNTDILNSSLDGSPERVIIHWTGGGYVPSPDDLKAYHFIIDGNGDWNKGRHSVSDNDSTRDGNYAAHCYNMNTKSIGVAFAAMYDSTESPFNVGNHPITNEQWNSLYAGLGIICEHYGWSVTADRIMTHAEVESITGVKQRGKWDITVNPTTGQQDLARNVGRLIRSTVMADMAIRAGLDDAEGGEEDEGPARTGHRVPKDGKMNLPTLLETKEDYTSAAAYLFFTLAGLNADPFWSMHDNFDLVREWQRKHRLITDGIIGPKTWGALIEEIN